MANHVIYYGVVTDRARMDKYVKQSGEPVVFTSFDKELKQYQGKKLFNKYDVIPFDEAINKYPDAEVWNVFERPTYTPDLILKRVPPERIHFFEADLEYRKGCSYLGNFINYSGFNKFSPCCVARYMPNVKTSGTIRERLEHWQKYVTGLIDDIRNDRPNDCKNCPCLKYGFYPKTPKLRVLSLATSHPEDVCNFRCIYCYSKRALEMLKDNNRKQADDDYSTYEILRQLSEMPEYDTYDFVAMLSNGELFANKHCNEIFDILLKTKWKVKIVSNMSIYNEKFEQFLKTGRVISIVTSLDAGTSATYKKIKRVDCFDKTVNNLRNYTFYKCRLYVKYIFLEGINDNEADVMGFYNIAKELGATILISSDDYKPLNARMRKLATNLILQAKKDGITVVGDTYLNQKDISFVNDSYAQAPSEDEPATASIPQKSDATQVVQTQAAPSVQITSPSFNQYEAKIAISGNCIIYNPDKTGRITGRGRLELNRDLTPGSNAECEVVLGKNSIITVNGDVAMNSLTKVTLLENANLNIGSAYIQSGTQIVCGKNITIGDNVFISSNCHIVDTDDCTKESAPVTIGNKVWIGRNSVILKGVKICDGAIIPPGSVVDKDILK